MFKSNTVKQKVKNVQSCMGVITHKIDKDKGNFNKNMKRERKKNSKAPGEYKNNTKHNWWFAVFFFNQANKKCQRNIPVGIDGRRRFGKIFCT